MVTMLTLILFIIRSVSVFRAFIKVADHHSSSEVVAKGLLMESLASFRARIVSSPRSSRHKSYCSELG
jgi:hypothetical protein